MRKMFQTEAQTIPCPEYRKKKTLKKMLVLEEENTNSDLTPTPTLLKKTDISQKFQVLVPCLFIACPRGQILLLGTFLTYFCLI